MQILEYCTLLQACEWLAFGWEPLTKEGEMFMGKYVRTYMAECDMTNAIAKLAYGTQLAEIKNAKLQLLILFNHGLKCTIDNKVSSPKFQTGEDMDNMLYIGTPIYKSLYVIRPSKTPVPEPDYTNDNDQGLYIDGKWYYDIKINFLELQEVYNKCNAVSQVDPHFFRLFILGDKLCCQKDNEPVVELHTLSKGAKNTLVLQYIMANPGREITKDEIIQNSGTSKIRDDNTMPNIFQTLFKKLPDIKKAFFPILGAQTVMFRERVTNRELEEEGLPTPI